MTLPVGVVCLVRRSNCGTCLPSPARPRSARRGASDEELMARVQAEDRGAYEGPLFGSLLKRTGRRALAVEILIAP